MSGVAPAVRQADGSSGPCWQTAALWETQMAPRLPSAPSPRSPLAGSGLGQARRRRRQGQQAGRHGRRWAAWRRSSAGRARCVRPSSRAVPRGAPTRGRRATWFACGVADQRRRDGPSRACRRSGSNATPGAEGPAESPPSRGRAPAWARAAMKPCTASVCSRLRRSWRLRDPETLRQVRGTPGSMGEALQRFRTVPTEARSHRAMRASPRSVTIRRRRPAMVAWVARPSSSRRNASCAARLAVTPSRRAALRQPLRHDPRVEIE